MGELRRELTQKDARIRALERKTARMESLSEVVGDLQEQVDGMHQEQEAALWNHKDKRSKEVRDTLRGHMCYNTHHLAHTERLENGAVHASYV